VDAKNEADSTVFQTDKFLRDTGDKLDPSDKSRLEEELGKLKSVNDRVNIDNISDSDMQDLKSATDNLMNVFHDVSEKLYQQAGGQQGQQGYGQQQDYGQQSYGGGNDDVVDGDASEV